MTTSLNNEFGSFQTLSSLLESVNVCWSEFSRTLSRLKKKRGTFVDVRSLSFAHILYKTSPMGVIRRSCALEVKEMYGKARCTCRAVVLIIKITVFDVLVVVVVAA